MAFFFSPGSLRGRPEARKPWLGEAILEEWASILAAAVLMWAGTSAGPDARPMV